MDQTYLFCEVRTGPQWVGVREVAGQMASWMVWWASWLSTWQLGPLVSHLKETQMKESVRRGLRISLLAGAGDKTERGPGRQATYAYKLLVLNA